MIATVGLLGVLLATAASVLLIAKAWAAARSEVADRRSVETPVMMMLVGALVAFVALEVGILSHDFSIEYVADNSSSTTPLLFLLAGAWAALEGSIVLWGLVLAAFTYFVARTVGTDDRLGLVALSVIGVVALFWFGLMATVANPFRVCTEVVAGSCAQSSWFPFAAATAPADGIGANPLLQNHILMAVHPPMLYIGYVGFTAPFAFAIAAMIRGEHFGFLEMLACEGGLTRSRGSDQHHQRKLWYGDFHFSVFSSMARVLTTQRKLSTTSRPLLISTVVPLTEGPVFCGKCPCHCVGRRF